MRALIEPLNRSSEGSVVYSHWSATISNSALILSGLNPVDRATRVTLETSPPVAGALVRKYCQDFPCFAKRKGSAKAERATRIDSVASSIEGYDQMQLECPWARSMIAIVPSSVMGKRDPSKVPTIWELIFCRALRVLCSARVLLNSAQQRNDTRVLSKMAAFNHERRTLLLDI